MSFDQEMGLELLRKGAPCAFTAKIDRATQHFDGVGELFTAVVAAVNFIRAGGCAAQIMVMSGNEWRHVEVETKRINLQEFIERVLASMRVSDEKLMTAKINDLMNSTEQYCIVIEYKE